MSIQALQFSDADRIGRVSAVDTSRILIDVEDSGHITRVGIGNLIAVKGATESEFLIGITERVTRTLRDELLPDDIEDEEQGDFGPRAEDILRVMLIGTYRTIEGEEANKFKRGADTFPQIDRDCYLIDGGNLQRFMGLLAADVDEEERLQLGRFVIDPDAVAIANGDKFFQRHASVLGSTGSGKSWTVALILERANRLRHPNLILLDMHGEYGPLADGDPESGKEGFAQRFRIAGPGDLDVPNDDVIFLPYWLLNRDEMLSMILDRSDQNAPNQASRFTTHVRTLKQKTLEKNKKLDVKKTFTVDSPIPYEIKELVKLIDHDDNEMVEGARANSEKKGDWNGKLTRFLGRLKAKLDDRRYGFLFQPPISALKYDWLAEQVTRLLCSDDKCRGVKIIDFSEVPSDVLPVVTGTFARLLYDVQFWLRAENRTPFCFVCDEAHLYLPVKEDADAVEKQALATFERIAKEGRKYGVSLLVVSQRPSDVSRTILSQCNNFLVLRLTNDSDQSVVKRLMPDSMAGLTEILPLLDIGEALLLGDAVLLPTRIRLDKPSIHPKSGTRDFWKEWGTQEPSRTAIQEAVETLRRQTRPEP
jgi:hypothetical protein